MSAWLPVHQQAGAAEMAKKLQITFGHTLADLRDQLARMPGLSDLEAKRLEAKLTRQYEAR